MIARRPFDRHGRLRQPTPVWARVAAGFVSGLIVGAVLGAMVASRYVPAAHLQADTAVAVARRAVGELEYCVAGLKAQRVRFDDTIDLLIGTEWRAHGPGLRQARVQ